MKTYYKVVTEKNLSFYAGQYTIEYKVGKWVKPKLSGSRLFIFDNKKHACECADYYNKVYECEARGVISFNRIMLPKDLYDEYYENMILTRWKIFNRLIRQHKRASMPGNFPNGTMFAKEVKLIKCIKEAKQYLYPL